jgi:hypothetical protein
MGFDPISATTLATASLIAGGVGTGVSVLGQIQSANAQAAEAKYQSQVAANNQTIAEQNKEYAAKAGEAQAEQVSLANAERSSQAKAAFGAGYIDPNSGSAKDIGVSMRETGKLSTENTVQEAALQQYGYATQATNFGATAGLEAQKAAQAPIAGLIGAGGSLLQGVSGLASKYSWMQTNGIQPF